jgi:hypothetical protein
MVHAGEVNSQEVPLQNGGNNTMSNSLSPCDPKVFSEGSPLLLADTFTCGAESFDSWVKEVSKASGQNVDWHYSGGIAQVLHLGDRNAVAAAAQAIPCPARIMRWCEDASKGAFRAGVDPSPPGAIAGFLDVNGKQAFFIKDTTTEDTDSQPES